MRGDSEWYKILGKGVVFLAALFPLQQNHLGYLAQGRSGFRFLPRTPDRDLTVLKGLI